MKTTLRESCRAALAPNPSCSARRPHWRRSVQTTVLGLMVALLVFGPISEALAARSGGRLGGGSFRRSAPAAPSQSGGSSYGGPGYGGGFGFPFVMPFFGFGFGSFGTVLMVLVGLAVLNYLSGVARRGGETDETGGAITAGPVSVVQVQVGLLAEARSLQSELDQLGLSADTGSEEGRAQLLQEVSLALLRHPEYWYYGKAESEESRSDRAAEAAFNRRSLTERSKFTEETLTNREGQLRQGAAKAALPAGATANLNGSADAAAQGLALDPGPSEYIIVTVLAAVEGKFEFPSAVNNQDDLRVALNRLGSVGSDRLLAVEILWTPQAEDDALTTEDILTHYPELRLV